MIFILRLIVICIIFDAFCGESMKFGIYHPNACKFRQSVIVDLTLGVWHGSDILIMTTSSRVPKL